MKAKELMEAEPQKRDAEGQAVKVYRVGSDCSTDLERGKCSIARYINEEGAIITERDWCTKHGKERGLYELST